MIAYDHTIEIGAKRWADTQEHLGEAVQQASWLKLQLAVVSFKLESTSELCQSMRSQVGENEAKRGYRTDYERGMLAVVEAVEASLFSGLEVRRAG